MNSVFVDSAAIYAVLYQDENWHSTAAMEWRSLIAHEEHLVTSSYVVVEATAILQNRLGMEAVREFHLRILPMISIHHVTPEQLKGSLQLCLGINRRKLSLVDCSSFTVMRDLGIDRAFTFDAHFQEQGFHCIGLPKPADG